ncbi:choice-of-anchor Q domain-containing protein [Spirosoma telluris]|uniref:choice-of-anchor Q domain-containing protein n=1 Tax=Spirosoma telluris TaxID=2183553 RepID=UPI0012FB8C7C
MKLTNCVFENNRGEGGDGGGAVFVNGGSATIINSHFVSNTATNGGAVCFNGTNQQVTNSSFVGNVATEHGGAISNGSATLQLTNSSFQGNQAPQGGAVYSDYGRSQLVNSVFFNNGGANTFVLEDGFSPSLAASFSVFESGATGYSDAGNNLLSTVSPFVSATSTQLRDCSPAINTGSNQAYSTANGPATDLAGNARQYNGGVIDRGAYEYQGNPTLLTVSNPAISTATVGQVFSQPFTASGGGSGQYSYSVVSSNLPTSLSVSSAGVLSGTPTQTGSYSVLVQVSDANGCVGVASAAYSLTVSNVALPCGTVVFVTQNGAGLQNGSNWANAFAGTALQTAINTATTCGAQVWVAQGLYKPTTGTNRSISFVMKPGVAIYGGFRGTEGQLGDRPTIIPIADQPSSSTLSGDLSGDDGPDFANNADNSYHVIKNDNNGLDNTAVLDGFVISGAMQMETIQLMSGAEPSTVLAVVPA